MKNVHIITGGSSGIGLECAKNFKDGIVLIAGRNEEKLKNAQEILAKEGVLAEYKSTDISNRESLKELLEYGKSLGKVKTIINSAGVSGGMAGAKLTFEIDLLASEYLILESKEILEEGGVLILISSMMGYVVPSNPDYDNLLANPSQEGAIDALVKIVKDNSDLAYNFSKKGVHMLVEKYAKEFGKKNTRIVSVSPGIIMTPMAEKAAQDHPEQMEYMKSMTPMGRNGRPEDIASAVSFLADEKASFITGCDLRVDGGLTLSLPEIFKAYQGK